MTKCAKCGKNLECLMPDGSSYTMAGMLIQVSWEHAEKPEQAAHIKANLGKYAPADEAVTEVNFHFCFECQIDAFMFSDPSPHKLIEITAVGDERRKYIIAPEPTEEEDQWQTSE